MRIRRKKHLEERLAKVYDYIIIADKTMVNEKEAIQVKSYFNFDTIFENQNPVELEIGCGKGGFICQKALLNNKINYFAVEMMENIIVIAAEKAKENCIKNLRFINSGAAYLQRYIMPSSIKTIYLNFSPPYPKNSYENRRLTNDRFTKIYKELLVPGGCIYQKTDDKNFFEYSKNMFIKNGFTVCELTNDLSNEIFAIRTEYEEKFNKLNMPIYALCAQLKSPD